MHSLLVAAVFLLWFPVTALAEDKLLGDSDTKPSATTGASGFFGVGEIAKAAADLRAATESVEKILDRPDGIVAVIAESLATMSSEFDPFGYKTAFRTVAQQSEMLQSQRDIIHELQERELERLRNENRRLTKAIKKRRRRERAPKRRSQ